MRLAKRAFSLIAFLLVLLAVAAVGMAPALAQEGHDPERGSELTEEELLEQGEALFEENCAVCHGTSGMGKPPTFLALAGNDALDDLSLMVTNVSEGRGAMPAFPQFDDSDLPAVASYVRTAWDNEFGVVSVDDVASEVDTEAEEASLRSVWHRKSTGIGVGSAGFEQLIAVNQVGRRFYREDWMPGRTGTVEWIAGSDEGTPNDWSQHNVGDWRNNRPEWGHEMYGYVSAVDAALAMNEGSEPPGHLPGPLWAIFDQAAVDRAG